MFQTASPLPGNYFAEGACLRTNPATGVSRDRSGTRILSLTEDFLRGLQTAFRDECGPAAEGVLKTCARRWGRDFAIRLENTLSEHYGAPLRELGVGLFEVCLVECFAQHGWGLLHPDLSQHQHGLLLATVQHGALAELAESGERADPLLAGILAAVFSHFAGVELECVQTRFGAEACFVLGLPQRLEKVAERVAGGASHEDILGILLETRV